MSTEKSSSDGQMEKTSIYPDMPPEPPSYDDAVRPSAPIPVVTSRQVELPLSPVQQNVQNIEVAVQSPEQSILTFPLGRGACRMRCPQCRSDIMTETVTARKCLAHCSCLLLTIFGCWLCCCIPYCMDSCKRVTHKCPNCRTTLGVVA